MAFGFFGKVVSRVLADDGTKTSVTRVDVYQGRKGKGVPSHKRGHTVIKNGVVVYDRSPSGKVVKDTRK